MTSQKLEIIIIRCMHYENGITLIIKCNYFMHYSRYNYMSGFLVDTSKCQGNVDAIDEFLVLSGR